MKLYSIDVRIAATAYIVAQDKAQAFKLLSERQGFDLEDEEIIDGQPYRAMLLDKTPRLTLSPTMTLWGPYTLGDTLEEVEP